MRPGQLSDTSGNFVAAGVLGTFQVSVAAPPAPADALAHVSGLDVFSSLTGRLKHDASELLAWHTVGRNWLRCRRRAAVTATRRGRATLISRRHLLSFRRAESRNSLSPAWGGF